MLTRRGLPRYERADSRDTSAATMTPLHKPRLCIGLPVYNGENYVAQAIQSVLAQTFTDFRFIISDNASTDRTEEICRSYGRRDGRIEYHRGEENRGAAWNFNRVVALADAEYFKWTAHDDVCAPEFVARCVAALDQHPGAILCFPTSHVINEDGTIMSAYRSPAAPTGATPFARFNAIARKPGLCHMAFGVIRLDVLRATRLHGSYPGSDMVLLAELALRGKPIELDDALLLWRDHPQRGSRTCRSDADLATWFAPENAGRMPFVYWTLLANYLQAIAHAPIPFGQKLLCGGVMARWFLGRFRFLRNEVAHGVVGLVQPARRRSGGPGCDPGPTMRVA